MDDSATERTLTIKSLAFVSRPVCENKMSVVTLDDKSVGVLTDSRRR